MQLQLLILVLLCSLSTPMNIRRTKRYIPGFGGYGYNSIYPYYASSMGYGGLGGYGLGGYGLGGYGMYGNAYTFPLGGFGSYGYNPYSLVYG